MLIHGASLTSLAIAGSLLLGIAATPSLVASAAGTAWTTDHFDVARSGNDPNDPELAGTPVSAWTSPTVDGRIYGEPLFLNNTVYVATQRNSVYAFDAGDGHLLWSLANIVRPVPLSEVLTETGQPNGCGNIDPMGIIGTPVIDPALGTAGTMFAAAETYSGTANSNSIEHRLLRIDLATHTSTDRNLDGSVATTGATRGLEQERGALALAAGEVVVPYGGLAGDCGAYHGLAVSSLENLTGPVNTFTVDPSHVGGGIWAATGPSVDASGNVYVSTGNGTEPANSYDLSDAVVKLAPTMGQPPTSDTAHFFAPTVWLADNGSDLDLGSVSPILVPRPGNADMVFTTGKQHIGFLLDSANLGGIGGQLFPPTATQSSSGHVCDQDARGGNAYANGMLYVPCLEGLRALSINAAAPSFARAWLGPGDASGPPIIAGGRVWVHGSNRLYGLNATTGAIEVDLPVSTPYNFGSPSAGASSIVYPAGTSVVAFRATAANYLAAIGSDRSVWVKRDPGAWNPVAGQSTAAPAVVSLPNGSSGAPVFIMTGLDRDLYVRNLLTGWQRLNFNGSVVCVDNPAAVIANSTLSVACKGADNTLWVASAAVSAGQLPQVNRASWINLGGVLNSGPGVAVVSSAVTYFVEGADHHVYTRTGTAGYTPTPWYCTGHPAAATLGTTSHFACQGLDHGLWYASNTGSGWGGAQPFGGMLVDGPGIAAGPTGATIYVEGLDGSVWHRVIGGGWIDDGGIVRNGVGASYIP